MRKLSIAAAPATVAAGLAAGAAVGPVGRAGVVRPFSVQYMNGSRPITQAEALATARDFGVIVAHDGVMTPYLATLRAANPNLLVFAYQKGIFTYDAGLPEGAYSHDLDGNRVTGVRFPGTFMLDPLSPDVTAYELRRSKSVLASSGYDGVFLDTLGRATLSTTYVSSLPIDPGTGVPWTPGDWLTGTSTVGGAVAAGVTQPVMCNGLRAGPDYWDPAVQTSKLLTTGMAGCMAEGWLHLAIDPATVHPNETAWKQSVDALVDAGSRGASFFTMTKVWGPGTQAQKDAWYTFAVASYLLGSDGRAYFAFSYAPGDAPVAFPLNRLDLGPALGPYFEHRGVYQRKFTRGRALVNPTPRSATVTFAKPYRRLDGTLVTSVTLSPDTAVILTR
jgi:hypothetical protein